MNGPILRATMLRTMSLRGSMLLRNNEFTSVTLNRSLAAHVQPGAHVELADGVGGEPGVVLRPPAATSPDPLRSSRGGPGSPKDLTSRATTSMCSTS